MVLCFSSGLLKIWREGNKKPGAGAIIIDYISLLTLSIIIFVVTLSKTSMLAIWCLVPAFIVEIIIILLVGRRNRLSDL
jgi:tryptophan-rich sensory protein